MLLSVSALFRKAFVSTTAIRSTGKEEEREREREKLECFGMWGYLYVYIYA